MEKIIAVLGDRHNPEAHHIKLSGTVSVGRGFGCDVILSDAHAEPVQLVIHWAEGKRHVEVMAGINPVYCDGKPVASGTHPFVSGAEWSFGNTRLGLFTEEHPVNPAAGISGHQFRGRFLPQAAVFICGVATLIGFTALQAWLQNFEPLEWPQDFAQSISQSGALWFATFWTLLMAITSHGKFGRSYINTHLLAAVIYVVANKCLETLCNYAAYAFHHQTIWTLIYATGAILLLARLINNSFSLAMNARGIKYLAYGMAICYVGLTQLEKLTEQKPMDPVFNAAVKPPFAAITKPETVDSFMQQVNKSLNEPVDPE